MGVVDGHVHLRESKYVEGCAEWIGHGLGVCKKAKVDAVFDMPNTQDPIIYRDQVVDRLEAARACGLDVFYGLHIGVTADPKQIREAVRAYEEFFPRDGDKVGVIGLKAFMGRSTGNLEIIDDREQQGVYSTLGKLGYRGVLVDHCEEEGLMKPWLWYLSFQSSHSFARPAEAEFRSVGKQIRFAYVGGFGGTLHIAHVSSPATVRLIDAAKRNYGFNQVRSMRITCGVTAHHLFLNYGMMKDMTLKVNPPLRNVETQQGLLSCLKSGSIDQIESDHAPHLLRHKVGEPYASGLTALDSWPKVIRRLRLEGFDDRRIRELTRDNVLKNYGIPDGVVMDTSGDGDMNLDEYSYGYGDLI